MKERDEDLNRVLLQNHKEVNQGCSRKKKSPMWAFYFPFWKVACERGNFIDAEKLRINLLEVHSKMRYRVKDKLTNVLAQLLKIPAPK